jgi:hypothetical protein
VCVEKEEAHNGVACNENHPYSGGGKDQVSLFAVLIFNYVQHVHADEESRYNHSRNFTGLLNAMLFNNGYHTIHHEHPGVHWNETPGRPEGQRRPDRPVARGTEFLVVYHPRLSARSDPPAVQDSFDAAAPAGGGALTFSHVRGSQGGITI